MTGPGGRSVGGVSVQVSPDSSGFPQQLRRQLEGIEKRHKIRIGVALDRRGLDTELRALGQAVESATKISLPVGLDIAGLRAEATAAARAASGEEVTFNASLDRSSLRNISSLFGSAGGGGPTVPFNVRVQGADEANSAIGSIIGSLGRLTGSLAAIGVGQAAFQALSAGAIGLGSAAAQAAGSVGLLPGAFAAAGAATTTLVVGLQGMGDALSADSVSELAEAMGNLAPSARQAAVAMRALGPGLRELRLDVQSSLFADLAGQINTLANQYLPVLRSGMTGVAGALNQAAGEVAAFASNAQTVGDTATLFDNVRRGIEAFAPGIQPILAGFRDIGTVGSTVLADLAPGLANAGNRFGEFIARARESGALEEFFRNSVATLQEFGSILGNLGSILSSVFSAGAATGQSLLSSLNQLTESMAAFLNSAEGQAVLTAFFDTAAASAGALMSVFQALQPAISPLLSIVSTLANSAFAALATVITALAPVVTALAQALQPVAEQLGGVLTQAAQQLAPPLANIASVIGQVLLTALQALMPVLPVIIDAFTQVATILGGVLATALQTLQPIFPLITGALQQIAPLVPVIATAISQLLSALLPLLPPLIQLATALIPPLVAILQALIPPIATLVEALLSFLVPAFNAVIEVITAVVNFVSPAISTMANIVGGHFQAIANVVKGVMSAIGSIITSTIGPIIDFFRGAWEIASNLVSSAWERIKGAVSGGIGGVLDLVIGLPGDILNALGDLGSLLLQTGKDIILGLLNGLKDAAGAIGDFLIGLIKDAVGGVLDFLGIGSPSKLFMEIGTDTADGFTLGLAQGTPRAASAARDLAAAATFDPRSGGGTAPAGQGGNTINVYPRAEQSEWSIATQVDRTLAFAGRA